MEAERMIAMPEDQFRLHVVERLNAQDDAIAENTALTRKTEETVTKVAEDTAFMRTAWAEGIATVRFFCRLAAAWRFLLNQVVVPVGLPGLFIYALVYYANHGAVPGWISDAYKLLKVLL